MRAAGFGSLGARRARPWRRPRPLVVTSRAQQLNAKKARPLTRLIPWFARGEHVVCVSPLLASARKRHCTVPWNAAVRAWVTAHSARPTRQVRLSCNTHGLVGCAWLSCREVCGPPNGHGGLVRSRPSVSALMSAMTARSVAFRCGSFSWWSSVFFAERKFYGFLTGPRKKISPKTKTKPSARHWKSPDLKAPAVENFAWLPVGVYSNKPACGSVSLI